MITMLITIEDFNKVYDVKNFIHDNNIIINFEKKINDTLFIEVSGNVESVNKLYDIVLKINRNNSSFYHVYMKKYIKYIKQSPIGFLIGTSINICCLIDDSYNKIFDNNIFNFLICEIAILLIYLILFIRDNNKL